MREFSRAHCISFGVEPCHIFSSEYYYYYYHFRRLLYILHYFSLHFPSFTATMITTNYLRSLLCCWSFCFLSLLEYRSNVNYVLNSSIQKRPTKKKQYSEQTEHIENYENSAYFPLLRYDHFTLFKNLFYLLLEFTLFFLSFLCTLLLNISMYD